MNSATEEFFKEPSHEMLCSAEFVLKLESEMLFPELVGEAPHSQYMAHVASCVGPVSLHHLYGIGRLPLGLRGSLMNSSDIHQSETTKIELNLFGYPALRPHRIALHAAGASAPLERLSIEIRDRVIDGHVSAICLDMFRLLEASTLQTKKGNLAKPSLNVVAHVCEEYNFSRPRSRRGRPTVDTHQYPTLDQQHVKKIWRASSQSSALWAAYRAGSKRSWDRILSTHLLAGINRGRFIAHAVAFESERIRMAEARQPLTKPSPIGPKAAFDELKAILAAHVGTYTVIK